LFSVCFICALSHLLTKHVEISTLCARYSLQQLLSSPKTTWRWPSCAETCSCFSIHNH